MKKLNLLYNENRLTYLNYFGLQIINPLSNVWIFQPIFKIEQCSHFKQGYSITKFYPSLLKCFHKYSICLNDSLNPITIVPSSMYPL